MAGRICRALRIVWRVASSRSRSRSTASTDIAGSPACLTIAIISGNQTFWASPEAITILCRASASRAPPPCARPERGWAHPLTIVRPFAAIACARRSPCGVRWARSAPWQGRAVRLHPSAAASLRRLCRRAGGALRPPRPAPPRVQPLREHHEAPCAAGPHGALPLPTGSGHCWRTTPLQNASGRGPPPPTRFHNTLCPPGTHAGWRLWRPL
jgi:hypothetical protein